LPLDPDSQYGSGSTKSLNPDAIRIQIHTPAVSKHFSLKQVKISILNAYWNFDFKGIVSRDWKGLQMVSLDRFEVQRIPLYLFLI
jgi:hypothetical protein